jgi:DNA-binding MarR family transcriptional regulator
MKHKNFFIVSNQIFELGLKPKEFVVYCCLLRHSDKKTDNCFPSRRLIADECSMDKKTVDSALKESEARGLIKKVCRYLENGSRTSNMYYLASLLE